MNFWGWKCPIDSLYTGLPVTYCLKFFTKNFIRNIFSLMERKSQIQREKFLSRMSVNARRGICFIDAEWPKRLFVVQFVFLFYVWLNKNLLRRIRSSFIRQFAQKWDNHKLYQKVNQACVAKCFVFFFILCFSLNYAVELIRKCCLAS